MLDIRSFKSIRDMETLAPIKRKALLELKMAILLYAFGLATALFLALGVYNSVVKEMYFITVLDLFLIALLVKAVYRSFGMFTLIIDQYRVCKGFEMAFQNKE